MCVTKKQEIGGMKIVVNSLIVFIVTFLLASIAILTVGILLMVQDKGYVITVSEEIFSIPVPIVIIVIGSSLIILAIVGLIGAIRLIYCTLLTFAVLLVILALSDAGAGVTTLVLRGHAKEKITAKMTESMEKYNPKDPEAKDTKLMDLTQTTFNCCGVKNYKDWSTTPSAVHSYYLSQDLPPSCCEQNDDNATNCSLTNPYLRREACANILFEWVDWFMVVAGSCLILMSVYLVCGVCLSCCLAVGIQTDKALNKSSVRIDTSSKQKQKKQQSSTSKKSKGWSLFSS